MHWKKNVCNREAMLDKVHLTARAKTDVCFHIPVTIICSHNGPQELTDLLSLDGSPIARYYYGGSAAAAR